MPRCSAGMSTSTTELLQRINTLPSIAPLTADERKPLSKKEIAADHPTWCPGCGDFSVLALYFKLIEKRKLSGTVAFHCSSTAGCGMR